MSNRYLSLAAFLALVAAAAAFAAAFPAGEWYFETMNQPDWIPPPWLFGPVWSVLYVMMAIAAWLVWETGHRMRNGAIAWWLIQLALNAIWSWLFFGIHRVGFALLEMTILIGVLVMCIQAFRGVSGRAALLLLPYLAWLLFAWVLNLTIWLMNGGGLGSIIG